MKRPSIREAADPSFGSCHDEAAPREPLRHGLLKRAYQRLRRLFSRQAEDVAPAPSRAQVIFDTHSPTEIDQRIKRVTAVKLRLRLSSADAALDSLQRELSDEYNALRDARMHGLCPRGCDRNVSPIVRRRHRLENRAGRTAKRPRPFP